MRIAAHFLVGRFALARAEDRHFQVDAESRLLGRCDWQQGKDRSTPLMVLVHGLEGSSDSKYILGIAEKAWQRGFHVVRMNQRNCGGTERLTPTLYNSGMSADYRAIFDQLSAGRAFSSLS